jgi:hypothetical protein
MPKRNFAEHKWRKKGLFCRNFAKTIWIHSFILQTFRQICSRLEEIISLDLDMQMDIQQEYSPWISKKCSIDMGMQNEHTAGKCGKDTQHGNTTCACSMLMLLHVTVIYCSSDLQYEHAV